MIQRYFFLAPLAFRDLYTLNPSTGVYSYVFIVQYKLGNLAYSREAIVARRAAGLPASMYVVCM